MQSPCSSVGEGSHGESSPPSAGRGLLSLLSRITQPLRSPATSAEVSNTRPGNLPPKDPQEEAKYKREAASMARLVRKQLRQEERDEARRRKQRLSREARIVEAKRVWETIILPEWELRKGSRKVRQMCWSGIPPNMRERVWPLLMGNSLNVTKDLYRIHVQRAQKACDAADSEEADGELDREGTVSLIPVDISRTFPQLGFFQVEGPSHEALGRVLQAWACYRPDVGYVQGMSYVAAVFLLVMDEYLAFQCMANLLSLPLFVPFYRMDMDHVGKFSAVLHELVAQELPEVGQHLDEVGFSPDMYVVDWLFTLFAKALPLDVATRVWDYFFLLCPGDAAVAFWFRTALAILTLGRDTLVRGTLEQCLRWVRDLAASTQLVADDFMAVVEGVRTTDKHVADALGRHSLSL